MDALLNAFGIDWKLLLVQAVNFGILIVALWHFLYKPVVKLLESRRLEVAQSVEDAEKATALLAGADGEASARIKSADAEAVALVETARKSAQAEKARILKEAETRAERAAKDSEARAAEAIAKARKESDKEIARLAILAAEKVLQKK